MEIKKEISKLAQLCLNKKWNHPFDIKNLRRGCSFCDDAVHRSIIKYSEQKHICKECICPTELCNPPNRISELPFGFFQVMSEKGIDTNVGKLEDRIIGYDGNLDEEVDHMISLFKKYIIN